MIIIEGGDCFVDGVGDIVEDKWMMQWQGQIIDSWFGDVKQFCREGGIGQYLLMCIVGGQ